MTANKPVKTLALLFLTALVFYFVAYAAIEHRRTRKGPWTVTFTNTPAGLLVTRVDQPALAISNVQLVFSDATFPVTSPQIVRFEKPKPVPFALPVGECVFLDTTFLPGTVVLHLAGHEVQLIPRVLTIDGREQPWRSGESISIPAISTNAARHISDR